MARQEPYMRQVIVQFRIASRDPSNAGQDRQRERSFLAPGLPRDSMLRGNYVLPMAMLNVPRQQRNIEAVQTRQTVYQRRKRSVR